MTAWQDQPPLSRRQVRQNERGGPASGRDGSGEDNVDSTGIAREGWEAEARRAAGDRSAPEMIDDAGSRSTPTPAPGGRRAQRAQQPATPTETQAESEPLLSPEPLHYSTHGRPPQPGIQKSTTDASGAPAVATALPGEQVDGQPVFRVRDFSPEGRRNSFVPITSSPSPVQRAADLDYRTQGAPLRHLDAAHSTPAEVPVADAFAAPIEARTMSRRELRALERKGLTAPPEYDIRPLLVSRRAVAVAGDAPPDAASAVAVGVGASVAASVAFVPPAEPAAAEAQAAIEPPALVEPPRVVSPPTFVVPAPVPELATPDPLLVRRGRVRTVSNDNRGVDALAEFDALTGQSDAPVFLEPPKADPREGAPRSVSSSEPSTFTPPFGHWSTQASIDDDEQAPESTITRNIAATSGAITTNALVIPSLPSESALRPFGNTGEIMITGTIDLPRSLGSTGAHPARYDHSDVDALLEATDREDWSNTDSAPVRAIRAVSTQSSTRGIMDVTKPKGSSRLPMILAITGGAILLAAVALVIVAMVTGIF